MAAPTKESNVELMAMSILFFASVNQHDALAVDIFFFGAFFIFTILGFVTVVVPRIPGSIQKL